MIVEIRGRAGFLVVSQNRFPEISGSGLTITSFNNWYDLIREKDDGVNREEQRKRHDFN